VDPEEIMHSRTAVSVAVVTVALTGCGGTNTPSTPSTPSTQTHKGPPPVRSVTYSVPLSGKTVVSGTHKAPPGALNASGLAVISVNASSNELCWRFSQLKNVGSPTVARIYLAAGPGSYLYGTPLGHPFKAAGCLPKNPIFLGFLGARPLEFYVSIHNAQFPGGVVRGQV
jgi:hypothetical protein